MQVLALRLLEPGRPLPMSALADALHCDNSNVTGIVDRLEQRGVVERRTGERDRRVKMLEVTEEGSRLREQLAERFSRPPEALARLPLSDQQALLEILRRPLGREPSAPASG